MNFIFDLGRVVLEWDPERIVAEAFDDDATRAKVLAEVFQHEDWLALDRGTMKQGEALERFAERTGQPVGQMRGLMERVCDALQPVEEVLLIIRSLKARGHVVVCLSNIHKAVHEHLTATHSFYRLFDGIVISAYVNMIKPEPGIFEYTLERYGLEPGETVFIDDLQENVDAAAKLGMQTVRFATPADCRDQLAKRWNIATPSPDGALNPKDLLQPGSEGQGDA